MMENQVTIKGTKDGLLIVLGDEDLDAVLADLEERLVQAAAFFTSGHVILQLGKRALQDEDLEKIVELLETQDMTLTTILSDSTTTRRLAQRRGYDTARPRPQPAPRPTETTDAMVVRRTLRSGQSLRHSGSVVVVGDVNPGAEIVAGGDVIVWGHLRGVVHAGALGDDRAFVCALSLAPTQLRIGSQIARPPEDETGTPQPEMARVKDGQIIVEGWKLDFGHFPDTTIR